MNKLHHLIDFFRFLKYLGIRQTILYFKKRNSNNDIFKLKIKNYNDPFFLRGRTSDAWIFDMNIVREEYSFFKPKTEIKTILDAGANIGAASRYFNKRWSKAKIVAIEPATDNYDLLVKNTQNIPAIKCLKGGLWSKDTRLSIIDDKAWKYALRVHEDLANGEIKAYSIASIMKLMEWDFIDLLKMDIEGSEIEVLLNGLDNWCHKIGSLIIELHPAIDMRGAGILFKAFADRNFNLKYRGENLVLIFNDHQKAVISTEISY